MLTLSRCMFFPHSWTIIQLARLGKAWAFFFWGRNVEEKMWRQDFQMRRLESSLSFRYMVVVVDKPSNVKV